MKQIKPGDRIWVKSPRLPVERKVGTVIGTRKTREGVRYIVEWEVDLVEPPNHHRGYLSDEIAHMSLRGTA